MRALFIMYYFEIQVMVFDWFDLNGFKWFDFYESKLMLLLQKLHNMGRIYSWFVSGGTIKTKI